MREIDYKVRLIMHRLLHSIWNAVFRATAKLNAVASKEAIKHDLLSLELIQDHVEDMT